MDCLEDRFIGCLLTSSIGDALGMAREHPHQIRTSKVTTFEDGYLPAGHYTDDTNQTIILAESLIENDGIDLEDYKKKIVSDTEPKRGIGPTLRTFILKEQGIDICENIRPTNGAAMKVSPLALFFSYKSDSELSSAVECVAGITHKHPASVAGAVAIAQSIKYVLENEIIDPSLFLNHVSNKVQEYDLELANQIKLRRYTDYGGCSVYSTIPQVLDIFSKDPSNVQSSLLKIVNSGGDADTKAAMFGAISGAYNGTNQLPGEWIHGLENELKGRDHIISLGKELYAITKGKEFQRLKLDKKPLKEYKLRDVIRLFW